MTTRLGLAEYLGGVLNQITPLGAFDLALRDAHAGVLASDVVTGGPLPAFDLAAVDGYAIRAQDAAAATETHPVRLSVIGELTATSWEPARLSPGSCYTVAAGSPLPAGADTVVPGDLSDRGPIAVDIDMPPQPGAYVLRAGDEVPAGGVVAAAGTYVSAAVVALLASAGVDHVQVRPRPRMIAVATGDELIQTGQASSPGQIVDANSHALAAAADEAGAQGFRTVSVPDDADALRKLLDDQSIRSDLVVITGGTGTSPGDMVRRSLSRHGVTFTDVGVYPCGVFGFGRIGLDATPVICLPGAPASALIGFEVLVRPVLQRLAGVDSVFRPSVKASLVGSVHSPRGFREFRPAFVTERRGGGYTAEPLAGGEHLLGGLAAANGLVVLGEKVSAVPNGTMVDVLLFDRRK